MSIVPANINDVGHRSLFGDFLIKKVPSSKNFAKILTKKLRKQIGEPSLSLVVKPITLFLKILTSCSKIDNNLIKNFGK